MRHLVPFLFLLLMGCASPRAEVIKTDTGIVFEATKGSVIKYKDKDVEAEFDSKSQPLINVGLPDVKVN